MRATQKEKQRGERRKEHTRNSDAQSYRGHEAKVVARVPGPGSNVLDI